MSGPSIGLGYLLGMSGIVAFGSIIPVVPTGAAVSVAASLARQEDPLILLAVVVGFGAVGAYLGDILTYAALRIAGEQLAQRFSWLRRGSASDTLNRLRGEIERHELRTLLLSRLIPGGRIPLLMAAALGGYSWRRFAVADIAAATLWAVVYAAIGLLGRAFFPQAWEGAVAAIVLVLLIGAAGAGWQRRRDAQARV